MTFKRQLLREPSRAATPSHPARAFAPEWTPHARAAQPDRDIWEI